MSQSLSLHSLSISTLLVPLIDFQVPWKVYTFVKFMFSKKATKIDKIFTIDLTLMSLVSHKKSCLVCVQLTNFQYSHNLSLTFFHSTKVRQPTEGRDNRLKINKYSVIFENSTICHIPNSFSYEKPGTFFIKIVWVESC